MSVIIDRMFETQTHVINIWSLTLSALACMYPRHFKMTRDFWECVQCVWLQKQPYYVALQRQMYVYKCKCRHTPSNTHIRLHYQTYNISKTTKHRRISDNPDICLPCYCFIRLVKKNGKHVRMFDIVVDICVFRHVYVCICKHTST